VARYALRGADLDITLAYELGSDEWVALETRLRGRPSAALSAQR
jgi:hypothetical protein